MIGRDTTLRAIIDEAEALPFDAARSGLLTAGLAEHCAAEHDVAGGAQHVLDVEACAVAMAMLACQEPDKLPAADELYARASRAGGPLGWVHYHLAEAHLAAGGYPEAAEHASAVDPAFFDGRDLHWRAVRLLEIRAVCLLRLGRVGEGVSSADQICGELARRGDSDDLAPPRDLVRTALSLVASGSQDLIEAGCRVLRAVSSSVELELWFPPGLVASMNGALESCG